MMRWGGNRHLRSYKSEEFREEDVWDVICGGEEANETTRKTTTPLSVSRRLPSAVRMIQGTSRYHQTHRVGSDQEDESDVMPHSAPVNVPDWSKIYGHGGPAPRRTNGGGSATSISPYDDDEDDNDGGFHGGEDEDDEYGGGNGRLPPHEWLAKKLAKSQIPTFSVCEGAGRTLKGRDLSRVRNAVLSKTGFI